MTSNQSIIQKSIAILSIFIMLLVAPAIFYDFLIFAYACVILFAIVRWKLAENNRITTPNLIIKWLFKGIFIYWGIIFGAGGNHYSTVFSSQYPLLSIFLNAVGFVFVYDILRFFNKIETKSKTPSGN